MRKGEDGVVLRRPGLLLLGLAAALAGCTSSPTPTRDGDVAELHMQGAPAPTPPAPGDRLEWEGRALAASPGAVREGLGQDYHLGFSQEPAGVYPGTRWYASTGSAVEPSDVTRDVSVLVDTDGHLRALRCLVAGPIRPDDAMLSRCAELAGLSPDTRSWVEAEARRVTSVVRGSERRAEGAVVMVTTVGDWSRRTQSVQITGEPL